MLILVIGGARSGKSAAAESLVHKLPAPVTYVATIAPDENDADLMRRIDLHQRRRPAAWTTLEAGADLPGRLRDVAGTVLLDSLGPWVARHSPGDDELVGLVGALTHRDGDTVVVSEEVGMSVHPSTEAGRVFRDAVGNVNQRLAEAADHTLFVVAGRLLRTAPVDADALIAGEV
jgi:adenosyl cobinamide kinase/adenosyl cobinamide phosphate guanylyltransferase